MNHSRKLNLNAFILKHAHYLKENYSQEKAEGFIQQTLKDYPTDLKKLIKLIRLSL